MEFIEYVTEYFTDAFSTPMRTVSQIIGFISALLGLITFSTTDRKKTLAVKLTSDIMWTASFLFGGAWSGALANGVNSVRDGVFYFKKPSWRGAWYIPAGFIAFYAMSGILTWNGEIGIIGILPIVAAFFAVIGLWSSNSLYTKILYIPASVLWIIYALNVYNIMAIVSNIFNLVSITVGLIRTFTKADAKEK